jgi:DNA helicase HerA-like ATPase
MNVITHVNLGRLSEQGSRPKVVLGFAREVVTGIFGQRGSGKSYTLGTVIEALGAKDPEANIGFNVNDRAVLILDTLNIYQYAAVPVSEIPDDSLRKTLSAKIAVFSLKETDIAVKTYYPEGRRKGFYTSRYEPFALDTSLIRPEDYAHIFEIDLFKDPTGHLLLAAFDAVKNSGYTHNSVERAGNEEAGLSELIEYLSDETNTAGSFERTTVRALRSRLQTLARDELFSSTPTLVSSMVRASEVTILLLGHLPPPMRSLIAAILVRQLFNLRSAAAEANKTLRLDSGISESERAEAVRTIESSPPRTLLCIDEAQGYAPPSKANPCTSILIQYVKEGRNHGLSLMITSQQPSAIHPEILSQVDCVIAHRLTVQSDIDAVLRSAKGRSPEKISSGTQALSPHDLLRELAQGQAYISHGDTTRAFISEIRPRVTAHGGIEG